MRRINLIVSCSENRVIGRGGRLPWHIPEDAGFFIEKTAGQIVVLGRICFESWPDAATRGRRVVVVTSRSGGRLAGEGVSTASSFAAALEAARRLPGEIYVCGGERIYEEALGLRDPMRLYLTLVHAEVPGDRRFPEWRGMPWRETERREGSDASFRYTFLTLERP